MVTAKKNPEKSQVEYQVNLSKKNEGFVSVEKNQIQHHSHAINNKNTKE